jgi:hypothetical protein
MCKYCDKRVNNKQILDIDDDKENFIELRQVMMEELTYTLYVELDGEDIDGYKPFDYFRINYCPKCRQKIKLGGRIC